MPIPALVIALWVRHVSLVVLSFWTWKVLGMGLPGGRRKKETSSLARPESQPFWA